ncbi:MAG: hypothetical protein ACYC3X_04490 [Pirellulaceae bacterium]
MKHIGPVLPLVNRVVVFAGSIAMLIGIAAGLATPRFRNELNVAYCFVLVAFAVLACVGVWISLNWRNVTEEELDAFPPVDDRPSTPDDVIDGRFASDQPWMGMVDVAGALGGLCGGVLLTPRHANDSTLGVFVLCGAILGVFAGRLLIYLADRWLRVDLAQLVGHGVIGGIWGSAVSTVIAPVIGWSTLPTLALILAGAISGVLIGRIRYRK